MWTKYLIVFPFLLVSNFASATCILLPGGSTECHAPGDGPIQEGHWISKIVAREEASADDLVAKLMTRWPAFRTYSPKDYKSASIAVIRHVWSGATECQPSDPKLTYDEASSFTLCLKDSDDGRSKGTCMAGASSAPAQIDPCLYK